MHLADSERKKLLARLKRAEGQVAAVRRMIEDDAYCVDVLLQLQAARGALGKAGQVLLRSHVEGCVQEAFTHGGEDERTQKIDELMDVFGRYAGLGRR